MKVLNPLAAFKRSHALFKLPSAIHLIKIHTIHSPLRHSNYILKWDSSRIKILQINQVFVINLQQLPEFFSQGRVGKMLTINLETVFSISSFFFFSFFFFLLFSKYHLRFILKAMFTHSWRPTIDWKKKLSIVLFSHRSTAVDYLWAQHTGTAQYFDDFSSFTVHSELPVDGRSSQMLPPPELRTPTGGQFKL